MQEEKDPLPGAPAPDGKIEFPAGRLALPGTRSGRLVNAWSLSLCGAIAALAGLCVFRPDPYLDILRFVPEGLFILYNEKAGTAFIGMNEDFQYS